MDQSKRQARSTVEKSFHVNSSWTCNAICSVLGNWSVSDMRLIGVVAQLAPLAQMRCCVPNACFFLPLLAML